MSCRSIVSLQKTPGSSRLLRPPSLALAWQAIRSASTQRQCQGECVGSPKVAHRRFVEQPGLQPHLPAPLHQLLKNWLAPLTPAPSLASWMESHEDEEVLQCTTSVTVQKPWVVREISIPRKRTPPSVTSCKGLVFQIALIAAASSLMISVFPHKRRSSTYTTKIPMSTEPSCNTDHHEGSTRPL